EVVQGSEPALPTRKAAGQGVFRVRLSCVRARALCSEGRRRAEVQPRAGSSVTTVKPQLPGHSLRSAGSTSQRSYAAARRWRSNDRENRMRTIPALRKAAVLAAALVVVGLPGAARRAEADTTVDLTMSNFHY